MSALTRERAEVLGSYYCDPSLADAAADGWEEEPFLQFAHPSGCRVEMTGPNGAWVAVTPQGRALGRRVTTSYYSKPSAAMRRLKDEGFLGGGT